MCGLTSSTNATADVDNRHGFILPRMLKIGHYLVANVCMVNVIGLLVRIISTSQLALSSSASYFKETGMLNKTIKKLTLIMLGLGSAGLVHATYPDKPIVITVPFAAGGPTDTVARQVAQAMQKTLKQSVIVENVGGAGGTLGVAKVVKAGNTDGYNLVLTHLGMATAPAVYKGRLSYDPLKDFEYIGQVVDVPMVFVTRPGLPVKDFKDLIAYAKSKAGNATMANAGVSSASHLCGLLFQSAIQTDLNTIPYKGTGPALTDVMGDRIDMMCDQTTNVTSHIQGGKIKALAVAGTKKVATFPQLPLAQDAGGLKGFNVTVWHGLYAPKGTNKEALDALGKALRAAVVDPDFVRKMQELGAEPATTQEATPEGLKNLLAAEIAKWDPLIKAAGIYAD